MTTGTRPVRNSPLARITGWLLAAILAANPAWGATATKEKKVALVIGNASYKGVPLINPVNDAKDIAAKLGRLGYEVILKTDVGLRDMSRAVTQFGQKLGEGSVALVYYAGHGIQARGRNFLIPVDAEIGQESSVRSEAMDVDQVLEQLQPARVSVVILDACRNNPFERRFRGGTGGGLAQMDAPKGTLIAYATAPGKVAMDGDGRNGLYTAELLKALDDPNRRVEDVFKQVRNNVARATGDQQIPWESSSLTGDLFLAGTGAKAIPAASGAATPAVATTDYDLEFWHSAERGGKADDYRAYLNKYPQGQFAELARARLKQGDAPVAARQATAPVFADTPDPTKDALEQAARLLKQGRAGEARGQFKSLVETLPASSTYLPHASYGLGLAQAGDGQCQNAVVTLHRAVAAWPGNTWAAAAWREIAACENNLGHPQKAQQATKILIANYPNSADAVWARQQLARLERHPPHLSRSSR